MRTWEPDDELVSLYVRLRHETLPIAPPQPVVELPEDWHEAAAPPDWAAWQPTEPLPVVTPRTPRRYLALAACIVPLLAVAGDVAGRWLR